MSILGNPITLGGGGAKLNIDFGTTPPSDTSKLWVPLESKPDVVSVTDLSSGLYSIEKLQYKTNFGNGNLACVGNKLYIIGGVKSQTGYGQSSRDIIIYNIDDGTTETISNVLHSKSATDKAGHSGGCVFVYGKYIYIFGGYSTASVTYGLLF